MAFLNPSSPSIVCWLILIEGRHCNLYINRLEDIDHCLTFTSRLCIVEDFLAVIQDYSINCDIPEHLNWFHVCVWLELTELLLVYIYELWLDYLVDVVAHDLCIILIFLLSCHLFHLGVVGVKCLQVFCDSFRILTYIDLV